MQYDAWPSLPRKHWPTAPRLCSGHVDIHIRRLHRCIVAQVRHGPDRSLSTEVMSMKEQTSSACLRRPAQRCRTAVSADEVLLISPGQLCFLYLLPREKYSAFMHGFCTLSRALCDHCADVVREQEVRVSDKQRDKQLRARGTSIRVDSSSTNAIID